MPYTPAQDLAGKHPLDTRTLLVTTDGSQLFMGDGNLITTLNISSITSSVVTESIFQSSIISASTAVRVGAKSDEFAHLYVSGSPGLTIAEFDNSAGSEVFKVDGSGFTVIRSGSFTGSVDVVYARVSELTASSISCSNYIATRNPTSPEMVATKNYVDGTNNGGLSLYFRSSSAGVDGYRNMFDIDVPFSASTTVTINNASASQYIAAFISPELQLTSIQRGSINVHVHAYRTGGNAANSLVPEVYIRSGSTEYLEIVGDEFPLTTLADSFYTVPLVISHSIITNLTDRLVCKFKVINGTGTPNVSFKIEDETSTGITIPVPLTNYVLKTGDTMTGTLLAPNISSSMITASIFAPGKMVIPTTLTTASALLMSGSMVFSASNNSSNLLYIYNGTVWKSASFV